MKNILSYQNGEFTGAEILTWAHYQVNNQTSHTTQGKYILKHYSNIKSNKLYRIFSSFKGTGCDEIIHKPMVIHKNENTLQ